MEIIIVSLDEAEEIVSQFPGFYRVLSISNPDKIVTFPGAKELLSLVFDDATQEQKESLLGGEVLLATQEDCLKALEFLQKEGHCIVHCTAGISRSTAIVLGYFLSKKKSYEEAVDHLFRLNPYADPNTYIVKLMCQILKREEDYYPLFRYLRKIQLEDNHASPNYRYWEKLYNRK